MPLPQRLPELVMLADRLVNLPSAAHSLWKHNKIASPKADGLAPIRGHRHIPVQQQTGFALVVSPGECADVAAPNRPVTQPKRQDRALGTRRCDADHRATSADVSDSLISGRLTIPNKQSTLPTGCLSEQKTAETGKSHTQPKQPTQLTRSYQHSRQPQRSPEPRP